MRERLLSFIKKPSSRHITINTIGNYLNVAFTAFFALVLVRVMTPAEYGVLSVLLGIAYVLSNVLDFGVTATIYSTLPGILANERERVYQFVKTLFVYQSIFSGLIIAILLLGFPYIDHIFFKTDAPVWELSITALSVLFLIWQNFALNILFAAKKFLKANIYNNLQNVLKTAFLIFLIVAQKVSVGLVIGTFGILGPVIFFTLLILDRKDFIFLIAKAKVKREEFRLGYTMTYFIATQLYNLGSRMDLFLLSYFLLRNDVGYYGLAQKIILSIVSTVISITQVLSPSFAQVKTKREARYELKHGFLYLLLPTALFLLLLVIPNQVFTALFTDKFGKSAILAKNLVPAYVLFTLANLPLQFVLYTLKKPSIILYGNILYFGIMTGGSYYLIPGLGAGAPPLVNLFAILAPAALLTFATYYGYKKLPD